MQTWITKTKNYIKTLKLSEPRLINKLRLITNYKSLTEITVSPAARIRNSKTAFRTVWEKTSERSDTGAFRSWRNLSRKSKRTKSFKKFSMVVNWLLDDLYALFLIQCLWISVQEHRTILKCATILLNWMYLMIFFIYCLKISEFSRFSSVTLASLIISQQQIDCRFEVSIELQENLPCHGLICNSHLNYLLYFGCEVVFWYRTVLRW